MKADCIIPAPLVTRLSPYHTFDFLDAEYECPPAPGISNLYAPPYLTWYPQYGTQCIQSVHEFLRSVIEEDGPYDGVIGFSEGASLAASFLLCEEYRLHYGGKSAFKSAVFFNSVMLFSPSEDIGVDVTEEVRRQEETLARFLQGISCSSVLSDASQDANLSESSSPNSLDVWESRVDSDCKVFGFPSCFTSVQISIPTLHFVGIDDQFADHGRHLVKLCNPERGEVVISEVGHELPRSKKSLDKAAELFELLVSLS